MWKEVSEPFNLGIEVNVSLRPGRLGDIRLHREDTLCSSCLEGPGQVWSKVGNPLLFLAATPAAAKPLMHSLASKPLIQFVPLRSLYISGIISKTDT